jgi:hypothetical protein
MKLKVVVASMSVLGLVGSPVLANHTPHHKMMKHHVAAQQEDTMPVYKDLPPPEPVCTISQPAMTLITMTQNVGRAIPNACSAGWYNRIRFSGGMNVDIGKWGQRNANFQGENYQRLSVNDMYLNLGADVNEWTKAFLSISFSTPTTANNIGGITGGAGAFTPYNAQYSSPYNGLSTTSAGQTNFTVEQAYATLGNFDVSPVFLQIGKQFQDFSRYEIHPITRSLTQVLSEALETSVKLGFIANGFQGSIYVFDTPIPQFGTSHNRTDYGVALGYERPSDAIGFDVGVAYLYNLIGAQDVADAVNYFNSSNGFNDRAGGIAAYGDINSGPFVFGLRYTTAVQRFSAIDLPRRGTADTASGVVLASATGAKPWAAGAQATYGFENWGKAQNVYLGYQVSGQAAAISIPKNRWLLGYGIDVWNYVGFGVEWDHDTGYSTGSGGNSRNTNLITLRSTIKMS